MHRRFYIPITSRVFTLSLPFLPGYDAGSPGGNDGYGATAGYDSPSTPGYEPPTTTPYEPPTTTTYSTQPPQPQRVCKPYYETAMDDHCEPYTDKGRTDAKASGGCIAVFEKLNLMSFLVSL